MRGFSSLAKGVRLLITHVGSASGVFSKLGVVLGGLSGPVVAVVAVIGTLVAAFMNLWNIKLLWLGDKNKTLNYAPAADEMVLTVHRWFANKSCPGNWLYARLGDLAARVTVALGGSSSSGMQASSLKNLSEAEAVAKIGPLFTANQKTTDILACVSMAQFILESGYGKSELAQNANNCFGMKTSLSGNSWSGSSWDGKSVYQKKKQGTELLLQWLNQRL